MRRASLLLFITLLSTFSPAADITLIPEPSHIELQEGTFTITPTTDILPQANPPSIEAAANYFSRHMRLAAGFTPTVTATTRQDQPKNSIVLTTENADPALDEEGYDLSVTPDRILIHARTSTGIFYALQTLRQLLPPELERVTRAGNIEWTIPCLKITDKPQYKWRGLLLDTSRHFMAKEFVLRTIDLLALHKMNVLHLHLTDDEGWRFEIPGYPRLTESSHYSDEEIRQIVEHGHAMHVTVIPEIEIPGHSLSATHAYPNLSCNHTGQSPLCAGNDETLTFLYAAVDHLADLFDSPYIHLGGDERPAGVWSNCPQCQTRMKSENLKDENALQLWLLKKINDHIQEKKGRRAISWIIATPDEIHPASLNDLGHNAILQNWHDITSFAATKNFDVINSVHTSTYFDYPQFPTQPGQLLDLSHVYSFIPTPKNLTPDQAKHILGSEACLWTENIPQDKVDEQIFPRLLAFSEALWTVPDQKDFDSFRNRLRHYEKRLTEIGVHLAHN